ncbi:hypothetical protein K8I28_09910 [bacterium]|nr:hypothetical protein [bacterium]
MNVSNLYSSVDQLHCETSPMSSSHVSAAQLQEPSSGSCKFCGGEGQDCCSEMDKAEFSSDSWQKSKGSVSASSFVDDSTREEDEEHENSVRISGEEESEGHEQNPVKSAEPSIKNKPSKSDGGQPQSELSESEKKEVQELKERDREVRSHEQAHLAAAGGLANGGPVFEYEKGPDGRQYAVGGHVSVSIGEGDTPEERLKNAKQAERAALAPAEPSAQDRKVASKARAEAQKAQKEMSEEKAEEMEAGSKGSGETEKIDSKSSTPEDSSTSENEINGAGNSQFVDEDGFVFENDPAEPSEDKDTTNHEDDSLPTPLRPKNDEDDDDKNTPSSPAGTSPLNRRVSDLYGRNSGRSNPIGSFIYTLA